jgi:hypothetical protein
LEKCQAFSFGFSVGFSVAGFSTAFPSSLFILQPVGLFVLVFRFF